jgi:hypothetical protein
MSKRKHCRAPMFTPVLADINGEVVKVRGVNISQGGVLLDYLPEKIPESFQILFFLPRFPEFSKVDKKIMNMMNRHSLEHDFINVTVRHTRKGNIPKSFCHGYEFVNHDEDFDDIILKYTIQMVSNLSYYLNLFEIHDRNNKSEEGEQQIRSLAKILGHVDKNKTIALSSLRARGLHDFQNLDQL